MPPLRVVVNGVNGRMGAQVLATLVDHPDLLPVGGVDIATGHTEILLPDSSAYIPYGNTIEDVLSRCKSDVVVDFTNAAVTMDTAGVIIEQGVHMVIGTSGLNDQDMAKLAELSHRHDVGIIVVPNFALGGVILNHLVRIAGGFFEYADVFEAHHEAKIDSPSGTAIALAQAIASNKRFTRPKPQKESLPGTRGGDYEGVSIHSTRMPGRLAHHEVVFGSAGQSLTLRHDMLSRESFMPGVVMAVKEVVKRRGLLVGLESLLGLP